MAQVWMDWMRSWRYSGFCSLKRLQKRSGPTYLFVLAVEGLDELLLEEKDDLLDVAAGDHVEADGDGLSADLHVGRNEDAEEVHDEGAKIMLMLGSEGFDAVKDDKLDVVVGLFQNELDVAGGDG